ncbi:MAG: AAA family ATPase [Oscillospiraceae bacterium]|nr:AAA family ATPase [Oscillospiraceae bacterium]
MHPPEQAVHLPKHFSIKTRYLFHGKNGDGKTTFHQLFQWVFYGQVHFNKTTADRLYHLAYESQLPFGTTFDVMGRIDFEHPLRSNRWEGKPIPSQATPCASAELFRIKTQRGGFESERKKEGAQRRFRQD